MIYMAEIISKKLLRNSKAYAGMLFIGLFIIACAVSICLFVYSRGLNRNINSANPLKQPNKADQSNTTETSDASDEYALVNGGPSKMATAGLSTTEYFERLEKPTATFNLVVEEGKLISGPSKIEVNKDSTVRVNINVEDEEARVRLEGYEIITESDLPSPGGFSFIANKTGAFNFYALPEDEHEQSDFNKPQVLGQIIVK